MLEALRKELLIAVLAAFPEAEKLLKKIPNKAELLVKSKNYPLDENEQIYAEPLSTKDLQIFLKEILEATKAILLIIPAIKMAMRGYTQSVEIILNYNRTALASERISIEVADLPKSFYERFVKHLPMTGNDILKNLNIMLFAIAANAGLKSLAACALLLSETDANLVIHDGKTPLHVAAENGHARLVEFLLKFGAVVNKKTALGETALHYAIHYVSTNKSIDVVQMLIKYQADINVADQSGITPLHMAAWYGNARLTMLLLKNGANVHCCTPLGVTPLHSAVASKSIATIKLILNQDADPNTPDYYGVAPVHLAAQEDIPHILAMLLTHGGDVFLENKVGKAAYHFASKRDAAFKKVLFKEILKLDTPPISVFISEGDIAVLQEIIKENFEVTDTQLLDLLQWGFKNQSEYLIKLYKNIIDGCVEAKDTERLRFLIENGLPINPQQLLPLTCLALTEDDRELFFLINQCHYVGPSSQVPPSLEMVTDRRNMDCYKRDYYGRFFTRMANQETLLGLDKYAATKLYAHTRDLEGDIHWPEQAHLQAYMPRKI